MRLSLVFYMFLARMAVGTLWALPVVMTMRPAERHLRFQLVLAMVLAGGAAALYGAALGDDLHPEWPRGLAAFTTLSGGMPVTLVVVTVLALVANFLFGTYRRTAGRVVLVVACVAGILPVLGTAHMPPGDEPWQLAGRTTLGLLGGAAMGGVNDAMILGHFYLMIKGLPLEALKRSGYWCVGVLLARVVGFGLVLLFWPGAQDVLLGREVIWTAWRVCFGFVGPLTLIWMTRDALKYRHTQAATGILYVAIFFMLMGELAATWIEARTGFPV
ncbi:MAG: hypothetical protein JNM10_11100 [Planctomycetia bacterium]|nr:hypothetical protein [Planctomycetia bacterium]